jgi:hypothetical protein
MKISKPVIREDGDFAHYGVTIEYQHGVEELWYRTQKKFGGMLTDSADAALLSMLIPAMIAGENIHLEGAVSEKLYWNLTHRYQSILRSTIPGLRKVEIFPASFTRTDCGNTGVAAGFSGGVDAFCTVADHYFKQDVLSGYRLTHLLFNNVNSHTPAGSKDRLRLYEQRCRSLEPVADEIGLPIVFINSNQGLFFPCEYNFNHTCSPRHIAATLILQKGIGKFLFSSSGTYEEVSVAPPFICFSDAVSVPMLSTGNMEVISVGNEYTRVEKMLKISEFAVVRNSLDVCVAGTQPGNCTACEKCFRTLITLEIAGLLNKFSGCFNLEAFHRKKKHYYAAIIRGAKPRTYAKEILDYAKEKNFRFPLSAVFSAKFDQPFHRIKKNLRPLFSVIKPKKSRTRQFQARA